MYGGRRKSGARSQLIPNHVRPIRHDREDGVAIPSSALPGHRALHERAVAALSVCEESQDVDFKESAAWDVLQHTITRTVLGMGNLRDGGVIIIGVSERGDSWALDGIEAADLATFDADTIIGHVDSYVSPSVDLDVVLLEYKSKPFLLVGVRIPRHPACLLQERAGWDEPAEGNRVHPSNRRPPHQSGDGRQRDA